MVSFISMRFLALILSSILTLFIASYYIDGVNLTGGYVELIVAGIVIAVINFLLKPGLKMIFGPFIILSLGLFIILINMGLLWIADLILPQIEFSGFSSLLLTTLLLGITNFIVSISFKKH